jgi:hypothetical protein
MTKTAVFVEGHSELIFVRELLLKMFEYQNISLECYTLFTDSAFHPAEYAFPNDNAEHYFQIINCGNDQSVITRILRRQQFMENAGFQKIIGLRDMYSKAYRDIVQQPVINQQVNQQFIEAHREQVNPDIISFSFAIMELEAWILGLHQCLTKMDGRLTPEFIEQHRGYNIALTNPETAFFHPADEMDSIFQLINRRYDKSQGSINAIVAYLDKEDIINLTATDKCNSFKEFCGFLGLVEC